MARGNEKGHVESLVGYHRRNFLVPVPSFASFAELNAYLTRRCEEELDRTVRGKSQTKRQRLETDRAAMLGFPATSFESRKVTHAKSNSLSLVRFDRNDYSVPTAYAHQDVVVIGGIESIKIVAQGHLVATHTRSWDKAQTFYEPFHYLALLERKPGAFDAARPLEDWQLPACFWSLRRRLEVDMGPSGIREFMKRLEAKSMVLLKHHLKALRLPTIGAECEKVAGQAAADNNVDHLSFLLQLCELELLERERKSAERRMKAAKFPSTKSLATFDFLARPSVNKMLVLELARCSFIDERENVLFIGNPGTGKSHLATAIAAEACAKGYNVRFFRVTELVTMLIEAKDQPVLARLKTQLSKLDLLVLDELGYVPATKVGAELLFDVIATAYERSSIMVTTNLPFENWTEVLGSERLTGATLDRLTHRCKIIETKGESYRLQDAAKRSRIRKS